MKVQGIDKLPDNKQEYSIVRPGINVTFTLKPADMTAFSQIIDEPEPPVIHPVGGKAPYKDYKDSNYIKKLADYNEKQTNYFILSSISATEDLEWETVDMDDPETWSNFNQELLDLGLLPAEISGLVNAVLRANAMDDAYIKAAREEFLAGKVEAVVGD